MSYYVILYTRSSRIILHIDSYHMMPILCIKSHNMISKLYIILYYMSYHIIFISYHFIYHVISYYIYLMIPDYISYHIISISYHIKYDIISYHSIHHIISYHISKISYYTRWNIATCDMFPISSLQFCSSPIVLYLKADRIHAGWEPDWRLPTRMDAIAFGVNVHTQS